MQMKMKSIDLLCRLGLNRWRSHINDPLPLHIIKIIECFSNINIFIQHGIYIVNQDMTEKIHTKYNLPIRE